MDRLEYRLFRDGCVPFLLPAEQDRLMVGSRTAGKELNNIRKVFGKQQRRSWTEVKRKPGNSRKGVGQQQ
jgi:hypothetical protein